MKIAVINCYHQPDYVRARTLREAVSAQEDVTAYIIKNTHTGILRYPEVIWKTLKLRFSEKPDAYLLTFRGQEILPFILAIAGKKPVWFDEFIVPGAYLKQEKRKPSVKNTIKTTILKTGLPVYNFCLRRCTKILIDTPEHVELSSSISGISKDRYIALPVGTDESLFFPDVTIPKAKPFRIFYYSSVMQPLLGIPVVLRAAELLKDDPSIEFMLIGGKKAMKDAVEESVSKGARITYKDWAKFEDIPKLMHESSLLLGGPFGGTPQANKVITGKTFQTLACKLPTVIGESTTTNKYFTDRKNCLMVRQNNPEELVKAFIWAKNNPEKLKTIATEGRKLYNQHFSSGSLKTEVRKLVDTLEV